MNQKQTDSINKAHLLELEAKLNRLKESIDTEGREWC